MDSLEWLEVKYSASSQLPDLYNYSSSLVDDQILIFGGMQGNYSLSRKLFSIELEPQRTK